MAGFESTVRDRVACFCGDCVGETLNLGRFQDLLVIRADRDNYYYGPVPGIFFKLRNLDTFGDPRGLIFVGNSPVGISPLGIPSLRVGRLGCSIACHGHVFPTHSGDIGAEPPEAIRFEVCPPNLSEFCPLHGHFLVLMEGRPGADLKMTEQAFGHLRRYCLSLLWRGFASNIGRRSLSIKY